MLKLSLKLLFFTPLANGVSSDPLYQSQHLRLVIDGWQGALKCTRFIVERAGATVLGSGVLRLAAKREFLSVVERLLLKGGGIEDAVIPAGNFRSKWSALTEAAREGHVEVIKFLLKHGAVASLRTKGATEAHNSTAL